ncbi:hypothetical protein JHK87_039926 [Glycine soja]|nr:hypothetical protein JHK87_039926 [Glycine soja]
MPSDWRQRQQVGIMSLLRVLLSLFMYHHYSMFEGTALSKIKPVSLGPIPALHSLSMFVISATIFAGLLVFAAAKIKETRYTVEMESRFDISLHSIFFSLILSKGSAYRKDKALTVLRAQGRQATTKLEMQGISTIGKGPKRH